MHAQPDSEIIASEFSGEFPNKGTAAHSQDFTAEPLYSKQPARNISNLHILQFLVSVLSNRVVNTLP